MADINANLNAEESDSGFRFKGSGFRVEGSGCMAQGSGFNSGNARDSAPTWHFKAVKGDCLAVLTRCTLFSEAAKFIGA